MKLARLHSYFFALALSGLCLHAMAAVPILDDPACVKTLLPEEAKGLKICGERGAICSKYWPTQMEDIQKCEASTAWIRAAKAWPLALRQEVFGTVWPSEHTSSPASSEPAWKKLPRTGNASTGPQLNIPHTASTDPYAKTSSAITPEVAKEAGWNLGAITGVIKTAGQIAQDRSALESPEAAAQAKEVLSSVGLGEYAASDAAIAQGRKAEAASAATTGGSIFIPAPEALPPRNGGIPADPALPNLVAGAQGLCSLVRFTGARHYSQYSFNTWHMEYNPSVISRNDGRVQRARQSAGPFRWFELHVAGEDMDTYHCAMKFKDILNINISESNPRRNYITVIPRRDIPDIQKQDGLQATSNGYWKARSSAWHDRARERNSCDFTKVNGSNRDLINMEPSIYGTKDGYFGAPVFAYEDTLQYLYAYRKFFKEDASTLRKIYGESWSTQEFERVRANLIEKTDYSIKVLECHKKLGYPYARENAVAVVAADLNDKEHHAGARFTSLRDVPFSK